MCGVAGSDRREDGFTMSDEDDFEQADIGIEGNIWLADLAENLIHRDILLENLERPTYTLARIAGVLAREAQTPDQAEFAGIVLTEIIDCFLYGQVYRLKTREEVDQEVKSFAE